MNAANRYRKQMSDQLGITKNKYKIIGKYIIVQLSKGYVTLMDIDQLEFVKEHTLFVSKSSTNKNSKYYAFFDNYGKNKAIHQYVVGANMVDHIDRYPLDNRKCNLRPTTFSENNKNRTRVNTTSYEKEGDQYRATITYTTTHKFQKKTITTLWSSMEEAKRWVKEKTLELDQKNLDEQQLILRGEFEAVMSEYAQGCKWE